MRNRPSLTRRTARWSLLVAAVLQFGIAVVGPSGHVALPRAVSPTASALFGGGPEPGAPLPHDEYACAVCHSMASAGLPHFGTALPPLVEATHRELPEPLVLLTPLQRAPARARAPPLA